MTFVERKGIHSLTNNLCIFIHVNVFLCMTDKEK